MYTLFYLVLSLLVHDSIHTKLNTLLTILELTLQHSVMISLFQKTMPSGIWIDCLYAKALQPTVSPSLQSHLFQCLYLFALHVYFVFYLESVRCFSFILSNSDIESLFYFILYIESSTTSFLFFFTCIRLFSDIDLILVYTCQ